MEDLKDLADEVKKIWPSSRKWRLNEGLIEFSIETTKGDAWYPVWNSPVHVEEFVNSWKKLNPSK